MNKPKNHKKYATYIFLNLNGSDINIEEPIMSSSRVIPQGIANTVLLTKDFIMTEMSRLVAKPTSEKLDTLNGLWNSMGSMLVFLAKNSENIAAAKTEINTLVYDWLCRDYSYFTKNGLDIVVKDADKYNLEFKIKQEQCRPSTFVYFSSNDATKDLKISCDTDLGRLMEMILHTSNAEVKQLIAQLSNNDAITPEPVAAERSTSWGDEVESEPLPVLKQAPAPAPAAAASSSYANIAKTHLPASAAPAPVVNGKFSSRKHHHHSGGNTILFDPKIFAEALRVLDVDSNDEESQEENICDPI